MVEQTPWGRWREIVWVGNRGKNTYARFTGFPRSVPTLTGHVSFTSRPLNEWESRVSVNLRGRRVTILTVNKASRVTARDRQTTN